MDKLIKKERAELFKDESLDGNASDLVEITTYITEAQLLALEILQTAKAQEAQRQVDLSEIVRDAIDLLIQNKIIVMRRNNH